MLFVRLSVWWMLVAGGLCSSAWAGAATKPDGADRDDAVSAGILDRGALLIHLPGIAGYRACDFRMLGGLFDGGVQSREVVYDWTDNDPGLHALAAWDRNQLEAQKLADLIVAHVRTDPDSPLDLTAHSGGCGLAVWTLEKLPDDVKVNTVLLIAPALSPGYDLSVALRHVRRHVYVLSSTYDSIVLYTGTRLFGTIDGVQTEAAGYSGFVRPAGADAEQYKKLVPMPYQLDWGKLGNWGNHLGAMSGRFSKAMLAPLLEDSAATQPSEEHAAGN